MDNFDVMLNELIAGIEAMDPEVVATAILTSTAILATIVLGALIRYLMSAIGYSKMYRKAGEAGWKAFIPVYNTYNNYKIAWNGKFFFLYAGMYILFNAIYGATGLAIQIGAAVAGIILLVVDVKRNVKMAKRFGKGAGTGIALMFFPGITSMILGLGKAEYTAIAE